MRISVSPEATQGAPAQRWEGEYTEAFLQRLTARTGSPISPQALWELLRGAVHAAAEDANSAVAGTRHVSDHAAAAGAYLNLWRLAVPITCSWRNKLSILRRRFRPV